MTTYKASMLRHHLWVIAPSRGYWYLCITGTKPVRDDHVFASLEDAMRTAHELAHRHIEGKHSCDCAGELRWESASLKHSAGDDVVLSLGGVRSLAE